MLPLLAARSAAAQAASSQPAVAQPAATVRGMVHDSLAAAPLGGALVQLVADERDGSYGQSVLADKAGLFEFRDVPAGRYTLGFHHALLDSLGLEPIARSLVIGPGETTVRADLAVPSPARFRAAVCGNSTSADAGGVVVGVVRDARDRAPAAGVTVGAEWLELSFARTGMTRRRPRREVTTTAAGWFALCDVPSPGSVVLSASRGEVGTDPVEVQVPAGGFLRRELYVGEARVTLEPPTAAQKAATADSTTLLPRRVRTGTGRLSGRVVAAVGGKALAGAQVSVVDGPVARADANGNWSLADAPTGTRALEVRAVGHYPERRVVDVVPDAPPVQFALATLASVIDTVRVTAARLGTANLVAFEERRRTGQGRYLTAQDIARRQPQLTSDLFRAVPGVYWDGGTDPNAQILMRGIFAERCAPTVFLNGAMMNGLSANDLDLFVAPKDIVGIEVYAAGTAPPEFQNYGDTSAAGACGSIVIWSR